MPSTHMHDNHKFLLTKRSRLCIAGTLQSLEFFSEDQSALKVSYRVFYRLAKENKPHTIGERFIKSRAMDMVEFVCGKEQMKKIEKSSLSNNTERRRISDMSQNILDQVEYTVSFIVMYWQVKPFLNT